MKKAKTTLLIVLAVIVACNIYPISMVFKKLFDEKHFRYSTYDGGSTYYEFKRRDFRMAKATIQQCIDENPEMKDKNMYRLFWRNPLAFWRWGDYIFSERYRLPYKSWSDIEKARQSGTSVNCSQDF